MKEIQDILLNKISSDDMIGKCLLEARKVESQIEQRKLLGIKTKFSYDAVGQYGGTRRSKSKGKGRCRGRGHGCDRGRGRSQSQGGGDCNHRGCEHPPRKCHAYGQICNNCNGKNNYSCVCKSRARSQSQINGSQKDQQNRQSWPENKSGNFNQVTQDDSDEGHYNDYDETELEDYDSVMTLYYHDVRIHSSHQHKSKMMYNLKMTLHGWCRWK